MHMSKVLGVLLMRRLPRTQPLDCMRRILSGHGAWRCSANAVLPWPMPPVATPSTLFGPLAQAAAAIAIDN